MKTIRGFFISLALISAFSTFASAADPAYKLGAGDVISISVWKDETLNMQMVVPPDGVISFPLIRDVRVTDLTVAELRGIVTKRLSEFVPDCTVTVTLLNASSLKAYVIGKVNNPGEFPIGLETNVMQILAMAGGIHHFASPKDILILREENGETVKIPFNYHEVSRGENLKQNITLKRGDVVVVP